MDYSSFHEFSTRSTIFDRRCVPCERQPCNCAPDETCQESSRTCDTCPSITCVPNVPTPTGSSDSGSGGGGSNAGAIAGGVIGGLALIGGITFLVWWFVVRKRRANDPVQPEKNGAGGHQRSRSMQSIASTVLTRASNVIQIAYIPGVTNRSEPHSPGTLVPPVPPLPSAHASSAASNDQYLFTPRDLRASQYSAMTNDRRSIATSLARSSIATTIYRNDAVISPMPAQQVRTAKAAMVSVGSGANTPDNVSLRTVDTPAVPAITDAQLQKAGAKMSGSSIVARSVVARPVNVKGASKPKVPAVSEEEVDSDSSESVASHSRGKRFDNQGSQFDDSSDDEVENNSGSKPPTGAPQAHNIQISLSSPQDPFTDKSATPEIPTTTTSTSPAASSSTPAEAQQPSSIDANTNTSSTHPQRASLSSTQMLGHENQRSSSPFDDEHEVK